MPMRISLLNAERGSKQALEVFCDWRTAADGFM